MIHREYRVVVAIPEPVWRKFGRTQEFERACIEACKGYQESGTEFVSNAYAWATFADVAKGEECQKKLMDVMYKFAAKLLPEELE